ncbi:MAG TPA: cupin domain-containing protein [Thermoanaerobaculia bacterium]|nr:cupin domain-containing protein [Thermoanaerobaculia bacterium]
MESVESVIAALELIPHPEGGWYRETFRDLRPAGPAGPAASADLPGARGAFSVIYFLLRAGEISAWHRIKDAAEVWHHYAGAPLELSISLDGRQVATSTLGSDLALGERPQALVPAAAWQSARSRGGWTLAGCTVAPAFDFAAFELAPQGWRPG